MKCTVPYKAGPFVVSVPLLLQVDGYVFVFTFLFSAFNC